MHTLFSDPVGHGQCRAHYPLKCLALSFSFNLFVLFVNGSVTNAFLKMTAFVIYKTIFVFIQWAVFCLKLFYPGLRKVWVGFHGQIWGIVSTHFLYINTGIYNFGKIKLHFLFLSPCICVISMGFIFTANHQEKVFLEVPRYIFGTKCFI